MELPGDSRDREEGSSDAFLFRTDPIIIVLINSSQYNKEPAQVLVRWSLQHGYVDSYHIAIEVESDIILHRFVPLPKSSDPARVVSNAEVYDFELSAEDMARIDALDRGKEGTITWNPVDVD